jgi:hypothetical protein
VTWATSAQAVAQIAFDDADGDLQVAERLEFQLPNSIAGMDGCQCGAGGILSRPGDDRDAAAPG